MQKWLIAVLLICLIFQKSLPAPHSEGAIIDAMDNISFSITKEASMKGRIESEPGKVGSALKFSYEKECSGIFMTGSAGGKPEWTRPPGFRSG